MAIQLAQRLGSIQPSATLAITARALALKAQGKDIIPLAAGEPDFDTPEHIKAAANTAIAQGFTKYTAVEGTLALRQAIVNKFARENGLRYTPAHILVSCGCKHSIFNALRALLNPGDEVIIPAPYWVSYPDMVRLAQATPVILPTHIEHHFKMTPIELAQHITPHTRLLLLNSPSNPTGIAYTQAELQALGDVLIQHPHIAILSDDIYEHTLWEGTFSNILMAHPKLYDRTLLVNGVSKTYAMTGWRIGYAAGPLEWIQAMTILQSQSTSNATSIAQVAAQAALEGDQSCITTKVRHFKERHDFLVPALNALPGIQCLNSSGAFYAFAHIAGLYAHFPHIENDIQLSEFLLTEAGLAVVPGSAFGAPDYIRFSFAISLDRLKEAIHRLQRLLAT